MTDEELDNSLADLESDRVERKQSFTDGEKVREAVCAFANDLPNHRRPGVVLIGVDDGGLPVGLSVTDELLQNLASMRGDGNILPFPSLDVQKRTLRGKDVAIVIVHPSNGTPVKYKGRIWVRSGPRRGIASPDDERRLNEKRRHRDLPHDIRPLSAVGPDVLDEVLFRRTYLPAAVPVDVLEQNDRSLEHRYIAAKFAHPGPPVAPTLVGLLAVGKSPSDLLPGAYIQFLNIDGLELGDPVKDAQEVRGPLPDMMAELDDLLKANIQTAVDFTSGTVEHRAPTYPLSALQQLARNAVLHRSYENTNAPVRIYWFSDRIEIQNPGGPYGQVTVDNFGKPGAYDYRNPNVAAVMKELGYVQKFGMGIATARREMERNGNGPPEFEVDPSHVSVVLRKRA